MPKHKKKPKKLNFKLGFFIAPLVLAVIASVTLGIVHAATADPNKNYLYGTSASLCQTNSFVIIAPEKNTAHCILFSAKKETYIVQSPEGGQNGKCENKQAYLDTFTHGIKYDSKGFGILCAYFRNDTLEVTQDVIDANANGEVSQIKADCNNAKLTKGNCGIVAYIVDLINALSAIVGVVIVIMIAVAGIQYSASRDDPQAINAARNRIINAILALVFYLFIFAFLQWIIPGGVFHGK